LKPRSDPDCYTAGAAARTHVETCLKDAHEEAREIAKEALEESEKHNANLLICNNAM